MLYCIKATCRLRRNAVLENGSTYLSTTYRYVNTDDENWTAVMGGCHSKWKGEKKTMVDFERRSLGDMGIDNSGTGGSMEQAAVTGESSAGSRKHSVVGRVLVGLQKEKGFRDQYWKGAGGTSQLIGKRDVIRRTEKTSLVPFQTD